MYAALLPCIVLAASTAATKGDLPLAAEPPDAVLAEFSAIAKRIHDSSDAYMGFAQIDALEAAAADPAASREARLEAQAQCVAELLRVGGVRRAIEMLEPLFASGTVETLDTSQRARWHRLRGTAYLRQAELDNCIINHNRECCVFPLRGGGVHRIAGPAAESRASFLEYLKLQPEDRAVQWVINVLSMALGDYPEAVDPAYRVPPEAFRQEGPIRPFPNIAPALGLDTVSLAGGSVADDFDNDGFLDIVTTEMDPGHSAKFFRNLGDGRFEDRTQASGLYAQLGGIDLKQADFNNDGWMDLFIPRGAWLRESGRIRNSLLRNNGDGTFSDVTRAAGLAEPVAPSQVAVWADFDNDGWLDLFVGNEDASHIAPDQAFPSNLFRNNGDGTFADVAEAAGVAVRRFVKGACAIDMDNDGDQDLYVSCLFGPNLLFRNDGPWRFKEIAAAAGVTEPSGTSYQRAGMQNKHEKRGASFACAVLDMDQDGWLDMFIGNFSADAGDLMNYFNGRPVDDAVLPCVYRNNHDGTFTNIAREIGMNGPYRLMGMNHGDLENDGWPDFFLTTGTPDYLALMPNFMMRSEAGKRYVDVTTAGGFGNLQKGHGVSFADFDNDGDQDIHHEQGGAFPGDRYQNAFYLNPGPAGRFLYVVLEGRTSNRFGYGARVKLTLRTPAGMRVIHRLAGPGSSFGGNPSRLEIGLGDATRIEQLEVFWPASKTRSVYKRPKLDRQVRVVEGERRLRYLPLRRFSFEDRMGTHKAAAMEQGAAATGLESAATP